MLITEITNHVEQALEKILQQYKGKPLVEGLLAALVEQIQALENAIYPLDAGRQLYNAIGAQLDGIGQLVNLPRNGLSDQEYLVFILGTIAEDYSDDTLQTVDNIVETLFAPTLLLAFEMFPAEAAFAVGNSSLINDFGQSSSVVQQAINIIQKSIGGGIGLGSFTVCDPTNAFRTCRLTGAPAAFSFLTIPVAGQYNLFFGSNSTGSLNYNASNAVVQAAVQAIPGLSAVTVSGAYNSPGGFMIDWGDGAQVPISVDTNSTGTGINIFNSVVISPGTGGGYGDVNNPSAGGLYASAIYSNAGA